jgi:hypothetical protein
LLTVLRCASGIAVELVVMLTADQRTQAERQHSLCLIGRSESNHVTSASEGTRDVYGGRHALLGTLSRSESVGADYYGRDIVLQTPYSTALNVYL